GNIATVTVSNVIQSDANERILCCCIFFFQAEDGIRDKLVTGVQTCALPIWPSSRMAALFQTRILSVRSSVCAAPSKPGPRFETRSEERRVGKECRSRWAADH